MGNKVATRTGWTRVRFGDVVRLSTERCTDPAAAGIDRYVGLEHLDPGDLRIRAWGNVADGVTFTNRFHPGQVLFGKRRAYQRKVAIADFAGVCSSDIYVFESADTRLLPALLPFICQTEGFFEHALRTSAGSLSPRTNWTSLADYEFDLPPVDEQHYISGLAGKVIAVRESWAVARDAFSRAHAATIRSLLGGCANHETVPLGSACTRVGVGIASSAAHAYRENGVPMIRNNNIKQGFLDTSDIVYLDPAYDSENSSKRVCAGDVVTCRTGIPGASAVVPPEFHQAQTFTTLVTTPRADRLDSRYLCWWLNGPPGQSFIASRKAGAVQQNLNATLLAQMPISLPPLSKQQEIACRLDQSLASLRRIVDKSVASMQLPLPL